MQPKILFLDLETSPLISYNWGIWEQNAIKLVKDWYLLCFAYKWADEKTVHVESLTNGRRSEKKLIEKLHRLYNEADIIVCHNGNKFDIKKSNAKFLEYGMIPPTPHQKIDTLLEARKHFALTSNKLNDIAILLGIGEKVKHPGFEMWEGCMNGDQKWWSLMKKYNKQDVLLLEKVYNILLPWINRGKVAWDNRMQCPHCGSYDTQRRGALDSLSGRFQRHQCRSCAKWFKGSKIIRK